MPTALGRIAGAAEGRTLSWRTSRTIRTIAVNAVVAVYSVGLAIVGTGAVWPWERLQMAVSIEMEHN